MSRVIDHDWEQAINLDLPKIFRQLKAVYGVTPDTTTTVENAKYLGEFRVTVNDRDYLCHVETWEISIYPCHRAYDSDEPIYRAYAKEKSHSPGQHWWVRS